MLCGFPAITGSAATVRLDKYEMIDMFKHLGMMGDDYDSVTIEWSKPVTRAEFAFHAANVLKRGYSSSELYYHDISKQHWASASISTLVECGLLEVNPEKMFYPEDIVTADDAARVIVRALGYRFELNDFENNKPINIADRIGITKGVSNRDALTFSDVCTMLYNALITEVMESSSATGNKLEYKNSGNIYLETEYKISYKKGIVEGYDGISANGANVGLNMAMISGDECQAGDIDLTDLIGCTVVYLYDHSDGDDSKKLIWVNKRDTEELTLYYAENEISFDPSDYKLTYYEADTNKKKSIKISKTVDVIYNDEYVFHGIEDLINGDMYSAKFIKGTHESEYSKIILSGYRDIVVSSVDTVNEGVYDRITKEFLSFSVVSRLDIINRDGSRMDFDDLKIGDVLSVYTSQSGSRVKILVSDTVISGQINKQYIENGFERMTINGTEYIGAGKGSYWEGLSNLFVNVYLDANGRIAFVERGSQHGNLALLIKAYHEDWEERLKVRLFKTDGQIVECECVENLRIDNTKFNDAKAAFNAMGGSSFTSTLILYKTNSEGLITNIYMPSKSSNANLKLLQDKVSGTYRSTGRIGRKAFINNSTLIFGIPKNPRSAEYKDFEILSKSNMVGDQGYTYSTYTTSDEVGYEEIMVLHNYEYKESGSKGMLLTKVYEGINQDNEPIYCLEGYDGSNLISLKCDTSCSLSNVYIGNYITYEVKKDNSVATINVRCDYEHDIKPIQTNLHQTTAFSSGYVNDVIGEIVRIGDSSGADFDAAYNFESKIPVVVFNTETKKARIGGIADLKTYKQNGEDCSFVFTHVKGGVSTVYVVYE